MKKVLIIEDDASLVVGLTSALSGEGFQTEVARTGPRGCRWPSRAAPT